jgi:predicted RNA-binding protein with TRAM domain
MLCNRWFDQKYAKQKNNEMTHGKAVDSGIEDNGKVWEAAAITQGFIIFIHPLLIFKTIQ